MKGKPPRIIFSLFALVGLATILGYLGVRAADQNGTAPNPPFNIPVPTLGGKQLWSDVALAGKWRIQENALTGHCRVLDENDVRQAWGDLEDCQAALEKAANDHENLVFGDPHLVLLLHGLGRNRTSLADLEAAIEGAGMQSANIGYASTRLDLELQAENLIRLVRSLKGVEHISFVTHSLGGLVVRQALADEGWPPGINVDGLVMLAPPSTGAELADRLERFTSLRLLIGPPGQELTTAGAATVPLPEVRHCVIAGGRGDDEGYNPVLEGDDDGIVRVAEARLPGSDDFLLVDAIHTFIMDAPEAVKATIRFLNGARCDRLEN